MQDDFSLSSTVRDSIPRADFASIKRAVLGNSYRLSLVFIGRDLSQKLNRRYRTKEYVPNVLAFPLARTEGEIFITPRKAREQAPSYGMSERKFIIYLFIHGLLHLKGLPHGGKMDEMEKRLLSRFAPK